jgi:hypothetical protein
LDKPNFVFEVVGSPTHHLSQRRQIVFVSQFDKIKNYDDLNSLFFQVLARKYDERNEDVKKAF